MKRETLGVTTALVAGAALFTPATLGANAAPQPRNLTQQEALHAAAERAGTISSALGLSGAERLVPRDVVRDAGGTHHLRFDRTLNALKVIDRTLTTKFTSSTKYAAARTGTPAVNVK